MKRVLVERFGGAEMLQVVEEEMPQPGPGQVRVRITSIGMNHADLMARRGEYKLASGDPPFTPGLEAGGIIEMLGEGVQDRTTGERVTLGVDVPRAGLGSYRSHIVCAAEQTVPVPDVIPEQQLGALWLSYLTAWGCLVWKQRLRAGQVVVIPAASSAVALAAAQIARQIGAMAVGLTRSAHKVELLQQMPEAAYTHVLCTEDGEWVKHLKYLTDGGGVDVIFDPVAAGSFLEAEIRTLAQGGTIWIYGLLGKPGPLNVQALIRKQASLRGWALSELVAAGPEHYRCGYAYILEGFARGWFKQHLSMTFKLEDVREAQTFMEKGEHIGKLVLIP